MSEAMLSLLLSNTRIIVDEHARHERHASPGIGGAVQDQPPAEGDEVVLPGRAGQQPEARGGREVELFL